MARTKKRSPPRRVLVVDDNADAAGMVRALLELDGHAVAVANGGPAALKVARDFRPDVVLLDLGMPGMDGYTVAARLRQEPAAAHAVLVAVTGYGRDEDIRRAHDAGFDHHLLKPVERRTLQVLLAELSPKDASSGSTGRRVAADPDLR